MDLEERLRPIADRPVDITKPGWGIRLAQSLHPLDQAGVRQETETLLGEPLLLTVERSGASNVLFRVKNTGTNSVRLPSAGYAREEYFSPVNTNPAYAIIERPMVSSGLWLTANWRYVGTNWFWASREDWQRHLQIRTLKPGDTLEVTNRWAWEPSLLQTNSNAIVTFSFQIPQDWARDYGLSQCSLSVTGFTE